MGRNPFFLSKANYDLLEDWLVVNIPRTVNVRHLPLGLTQRVCQVAAVATFLTFLFVNADFEKQIPAKGRLTSSWFENGNFEQLAQEATSRPYCVSPYSFDYDYCNRSTITATHNAFWCEDNIQCLYTDPNSIVVKQTPTDFWAVTYIKDKLTRQVASGTCTAADCNVGELPRVNGAGCQCVSVSNMFVAGAEGISVGFQHQFAVTRDQREFAEEVETTIRIRGKTYTDDDRTSGERHYAKGESVVFTIDELLGWFGIASLDEVDPTGMQWPGAVGTPSYRMTGVQFELRIVYSGSLDFRNTNPPRSVVYISLIQGWHTLGSDVHFEEYPNMQGSSGAVYHDRFRRGVHFTVRYDGSLGYFSPTYLFEALTVVTVLVGLVTKIVGVVLLWCLGYASKVYRNLVEEAVSLDLEHGRTAAEALIAANAFNSLSEPTPDGTRISADCLLQTFLKTGMGEDQAAVMVETLLENLDENRSNSLTFAEFYQAASVEHASEVERMTTQKLSRPSAVRDLVSNALEDARRSMRAVASVRDTGIPAPIEDAPQKPELPGAFPECVR